MISKFMTRHAGRVGNTAAAHLKQAPVKRNASDDGETSGSGDLFLFSRMLLFRSTPGPEQLLTVTPAL
jgi:hypothetical protein